MYTNTHNNDTKGISFGIFLFLSFSFFNTISHSYSKTVFSYSYSKHFSYCKRRTFSEADRHFLLFSFPYSGTDVWLFCSTAMGTRQYNSVESGQGRWRCSIIRRKWRGERRQKCMYTRRTTTAWESRSFFSFSNSFRRHSVRS